MITNSTEESKFPSSKLEGSSPTDDKTNKGSSSSSTPWLRLKDPRIVRVSRAFGGKDRHSKVCTIRGLRDRRVRLSVPTAIQLYDLQDRLGLNQPSKVVDWLLNIAKDEIDELPPLPIPPGSLGLNYQSILSHNSHESAPAPPHQTNEFKSNNNNVVDWENPGHESSRSSKFPNSDAFLRSKAKEDWTERTSEDQEKRGKNDLEQKQISSNDPSIRSNNSPHPSSFSALMNNVSSFGYQWEPTNLNLPSSHHIGSHGFITSQAEDLHSFNNVMSLPSPLSLSTGSQIFLCPPGLTQSLEIDPRQANHLQMLSSNSQNFQLHNSLTPSLQSINQLSMRPFHFSMAPKFVSQEKNNGDDDQDQPD